MRKWSVFLTTRINHLLIQPSSYITFQNDQISKVTIDGQNRDSIQHATNKNKERQVSYTEVSY